jgi:hypothetical protein
VLVVPSPCRRRAGLTLFPNERERDASSPVVDGARISPSPVCAYNPGPIAAAPHGIGVFYLRRTAERLVRHSELAATHGVAPERRHMGGVRRARPDKRGETI